MSNFSKFSKASRTDALREVDLQSLYSSVSGSCMMMLQFRITVTSMSVAYANRVSG